MKVLDYQISTCLPTFPIKNQTIINTINPHSYCVAKEDEIFKRSLKSSNILLPDGVGIVWAAKFLKGAQIQKISGFDLFIYLMEQLNKDEGRCFFLGASEATLELIRLRIKKDFPNVSVYSYSPPFKSQFSTEECELMCRKVNEIQPDILFVGMTAPKQEKWVYTNKKQLSVPIIASIGAVFDFYAGNSKRAPKWMINLGIEWLHRSLGSWRLAKRNLKSNPIFLKDLLVEKFL